MCIRDRPTNVPCERLAILDAGIRESNCVLMEVDVSCRLMEKMCIRDRNNIPEWAIFALEYGIEEELFLTDEEMCIRDRPFRAVW